MSNDIVDFHGHWFPPSVVEQRTTDGLPPAVREAWPLLTDLDRQLESAASAGTDVKVVCAPLSSLAPAATVSIEQLAARTNDEMAQAVGEHGGRLVALATVDAYSGDAGAEEARRAVEELGLPGILLDAAQGELLLSDPVARPTLEFAAERGIPVYAHPVNPPVLAPRYAARGGIGVLLARGSESALSTLALISSGTLTELPGLELVIAGIGGAALLLSTFLDRSDELAPLPSSERARLHIDTMGFDPAVIRFAVDVLGPERVLVGSDWPIMWREPSRRRVTETLAEIPIAPEERALIAGGNARRLLGLGSREPLQQSAF
jgi:predicted TIM-barrel fold metal-dependent hydrolase